MTRNMRGLSRLALLGAFVFLVAPAAASAAEWQPGVFYTVNGLVTYQGPTYKCVQAHTSQTGWEPPNVPALWARQSGATATATSRARVTPTSTPRPRVDPTATWTPTATSRATPPTAPWRPATSYQVGHTVLFDVGTYRALQAHMSDATHIPPNAPALWQNVSPPPPRCQPKITVSVSSAQPAIGQSITVTATGNVGLGRWGIQVIDAATGKVQDPANPIFTPAQPPGINTNGATVSWTVTAARAGRVAFHVSVNGEAQIPPGCFWAFTTASALSPTVAAGGASLHQSVLLGTNGFLNCSMEVVTPAKLRFSAVAGATYYDILYSAGSTTAPQPYAMAFKETTFSYWDKARPGYFVVRPVMPGGATSTQVQILFIPPACPAPTPTARPRPTP